MVSDKVPERYSAVDKGRCVQMSICLWFSRSAVWHMMPR